MRIANLEPIGELALVVPPLEVPAIGRAPELEATAAIASPGVGSSLRIASESRAALDQSIEREKAIVAGLEARVNVLMAQLDAAASTAGSLANEEASLLRKLEEKRNLRLAVGGYGLVLAALGPVGWGVAALAGAGLSLATLSNQLSDVRRRRTEAASTHRDLEQRVAAFRATANSKKGSLKELAGRRAALEVQRADAWSAIPFRQSPSDALSLLVSDVDRAKAILAILELEKSTLIELRTACIETKAFVDEAIKSLEANIANLKTEVAAAHQELLVTVLAVILGAAAIPSRVPLAVLTASSKLMALDGLDGIARLLADEVREIGARLLGAGLVDPSKLPAAVAGLLAHFAGEERAA